MNFLPKELLKIINFFEMLPGIGPKSARRLGFYLLRLPQTELIQASQAIASLKKTVLYCSICFNITDKDICVFCSNKSRDHSTIAVVEDVQNIEAFESGTQFNGVYHVLHGRLDPLNYIGPDELYIPQLFQRLTKNPKSYKEIIIATNPTTEGEATAMYLKNKLRESHIFDHIVLSRLAYGLPIGADLEFTDYMTLKHALDGRMKV